jgi:hypothetical protein
MQWVERITPVAVGVIALLLLGLIDLTSELNRLSTRLKFVVVSTIAAMPTPRSGNGLPWSGESSKTT